MAEQLFLASGGDDISVWTGDKYTNLIKRYQPHAKNISCLAWNNTNALLASTSTSGDRISVASRDADYHAVDYPITSEPICLCWHGSSRVLATGCNDGVVRLYDLKHKKVRKTYTGHKSPISCVKFNHTDTNLATGSKTGEVIIHSTVTETTTKLMTTLKLQAIQDLEYSQCKPTTLATVSDDASLVLWDTNAKRSVHQFARSHKAPATGLSFSPSNDKLLISCGLDKRIVLYDVASKTIVRNMQLDAPLSSICMHGDGCQIAAGSIRGQILIYDLRKSSNLQQSITAHRSSVQCLAFQHKDYKKLRDSSSDLKSDMKKSSSSDGIKSSNISAPSESKPAIEVEPTTIPATNGSSTSNIFSPEVGSGQSFQSKPSIPPSNLTGLSANGSVFSPDVIANTPPNSLPLQRNPSLPKPINGETTPVTSRQRVSLGSGVQTRTENFVQASPSTVAQSDGQPAKSNSVRFNSPQVSGTNQITVNGDVTDSHGASGGAPAAAVNTSMVHQLKEEIKNELKTEIVNDIKELMDTVKDELQQTIMDHHYEMIKQFFLAQNHTEAQMSHYSLNHNLLKENEELRAENERLRRKY